MYCGAPDWQFLSRFCSIDQEEIGWPFSIGEMIVATDSRIVAWVPYESPGSIPYVMPTHQHFSGCQISLDFLSRGGMTQPRKVLGDVIKSASSVEFEYPEWLEVETEGDFIFFKGMKFDAKLIARFPELKSVGLGVVGFSDGKTKGLFVRWGHHGMGLVLPCVEDPGNPTPDRLATHPTTKAQAALNASR